jgi:hypothetical protein
MLAGLIVAIVLALFFFVRGFRLAYQKNELLELYTLQTAKMEANSDPVKEDFLKFVSDSREWAFEYIEEVQKVITDFKTTVEPHINHFDKFGEVLSVQRPDYEAMKTISGAYKQLIAVLPGEDNAKVKE